MCEGQTQPALPTQDSASFRQSSGCLLIRRPFFLALTAIGVAAAVQRGGLSRRTVVLGLLAACLAFSDVAVRQYNEGAPLWPPMRRCFHETLRNGRRSSATLA